MSQFVSMRAKLNYLLDDVRWHDTVECVRDILPLLTFFLGHERTYKYGQNNCSDIAFKLPEWQFGQMPEVIKSRFY